MTANIPAEFRSPTLLVFLSVSKATLETCPAASALMKYAYLVECHDLSEHKPVSPEARDFLSNLASETLEPTPEIISATRAYADQLYDELLPALIEQTNDRATATQLMICSVLYKALDGPECEMRSAQCKGEADRIMLANPAGRKTAGQPASAAPAAPPAKSPAHTPPAAPPAYTPPAGAPAYTPPSGAPSYAPPTFTPSEPPSVYTRPGPPSQAALDGAPSFSPSAYAPPTGPPSYAPPTFTPTGAEAGDVEDGDIESLVASFQVPSGPPVGPSDADPDYPDVDLGASYSAPAEVAAPFDAAAATQTLRALGYPIQSFAPDVSEPCRKAILKALGEAVAAPPGQQLPALQRALEIWTTGVPQ
jgi:hypothetical protein